MYFMQCRFMFNSTQKYTLRQSARCHQVLQNPVMMAFSRRTFMKIALIFDEEEEKGVDGFGFTH